MNIAINGHSQVPPGFRFHPTEEELLLYYLKKKISCEKIDLDVIRNVDLNKIEPWDIQERCEIGMIRQNDWYFFSHKGKKYPTGSRTNRATRAGFWKATGRDKIIYCSSSGKQVGLRKTLVFYQGRAPHGRISDWIMHEYRLDESNTGTNVLNYPGDQTGPEEGWVVCRMFKKKYDQKINHATDQYRISTSITTSSSQTSTDHDDQTAQIIALGHSSYNSNDIEGDNCRVINDDNYPDMFLKLPKRVNESPNHELIVNQVLDSDLINWAAFNEYCYDGDDHDIQSPAVRSTSLFNKINFSSCTDQEDDYDKEMEEWSFGQILRMSC